MEQRVIVVGSGPAGLACAAELTRRGIEPLVLEKGDRPSAAWAGRYESLRFNTSRRHSAFPGVPFPREYGQFPTRDQYVAYLDAFATDRGVQVRTGTTVTRLEPHPQGWRLHTADETLSTRHVVVATGIYNEPHLPAWASAGGYAGRLVHAADYRGPAPFRGESVLVVGAGSTGMEIAHELAQGGAGSVRVAVRTPPNILYRSTAGVPADLPVPLFLRLPVPPVDRMLQRMQRWTVGDLSEFGLPLPAEGPISQLMRRGAGTAIVDRPVVQSIRDGAVRVVPAVGGLTGTGALLVDGTELAVDSVVAATGYRTGLDRLVGHLGVLDERGMPWEGTGREAAPGLRFVGYVYRPGITGYVGRLARSVADGISADLAGQASSTVPVSGGPARHR